MRGGGQEETAEDAGVELGWNAWRHKGIGRWDEMRRGDGERETPGMKTERERLWHERCSLKNPAFFCTQRFTRKHCIQGVNYILPFALKLSNSRSIPHTRGR